MPVLIAFIAFFAFALFGGALLAYPIHILLANWFELDFERVASRCVLIIAIVLFITLFRKFGFGSWQEIGFSSNQKQFWRELLKGFGAGILIMSPVVVGLLISKNRVIDLDWAWSSSNVSLLLITAVAAGLVIALIEETLFRGAMLTAIQRQSSNLFAVFSTSFLYAFVHFIEPKTNVVSHTLNWSSGFILLKYAFLPLLEPTKIVDSFIALFLAGVLLAIIKIRTNRLAICIGIHTGWVFTIKIFKRVTDSNTYSEYAFLTGSYDKVIGYLAAICIIIAIVICIRMKYRPQKY